MKTIIKKLVILYLKKEDKKIKYLLKKLLINKFHLLDIGAAEGINKRWEIIEDSMNISLVEPHKASRVKLEQQGHNVIEKIFYNLKDLKLDFFETKKPVCSSILKPNFEHLKKFLYPDRFEIINQSTLETTTLDDEFKINEIPHFVKIDTEGADLEILKGSKESLKYILGIEIECEFFELRKNQPLFDEIRQFLETYNFEFIDFLSMIRWERKNYRYTGQPQISDVLFLQKPELMIYNYKNNNIDDEILLKYIVILVIYNRSDLLNYLINNLEINFVNKFQLDQLHDLVEKKVMRINSIEKFSRSLILRIHNMV